MYPALMLTYPLAITMWDFSWLERRWPGAGYESWDEALDGLVLRGYDAVRIDAYPHLVAHDPGRTWELLPEWNQNVWGAPARCRVQVMPALIQFLEKCAVRGLRVGLSTWFRQDLDNLRLRVKSPADLAGIWRATLDAIDRAGLLGTLLYVDLCNEFLLLHWDWVKDLCERGVRQASASGRWAALGTSNFCGPQFVGMWRDVEWHQRLTEIIHQGRCPA
jgi:hypothetical protein